MFTLDTNTKELNRVGPSAYLKLKNIGIETLKDLIFYYPFRYEDFTKIVKIKNLEIGTSVTVVAKVELIASRKSFRNKVVLIEAIIADETGSVKVVWFNQPWIVKNIQPGDDISLSGKVSGDLNNIYFNSPEYEKIGSNFNSHNKIIPIYSLTHGLTQKQLSFFMRNIVDLVDKMEDYLPLHIVKDYALLSFYQAISNIHF